MTQKKDITLIAILGASASGKSDLALQIAQNIDAQIFSIDSLSIYREIDIASAKPTKEELATIKHYGIDELNLTEANNAIVFKNLLELAIEQTTKKTLLLTGGSSFYLKSIIEGLSPMPSLDADTKQELQSQIQALKNPYGFLCKIDPTYANLIKPADTYRLSKALEIFFATQTPPSLYFKANPKIPFPYPIKIYSIQIHKEQLRENIKLRTQKMLRIGIIEEIQYLLKKYPKDSQPFKAIGPKECIAYLEGKINLQELEKLIFIHTTQLAKRQNTFNKIQFKNIIQSDKEKIFDFITKNNF